MKSTLIGMLAAVLLLSWLAWSRGGMDLVLQGVLQGGSMALRVLPLLFVAVAIAGFIQLLITKQAVSRWLGKEAGMKGIWLGALAGALVPGGPYVYFPIAATLLVSGAEIGTVLAFVTAKNLWTLSRLPMEVALIGPEITIIRYVATFVFPVLLGLFANIVLSRAKPWIMKSQVLRQETFDSSETQ
ncbi:MAG: permease [Desulfohalobiaceae bacterium]|nr:permease [Desulfohalobiaceae bacterium]